MIRRDTPAKINLILKVLRKRPDGYHEIASLMQKINLADEMEFREGHAGVKLSCPASGLPEDSRNLVFRAATMVLAEAGEEKRGVDIILRKRVPTGAGLGGGSANAAATLVAVNEMLGLGFGEDRLLALGKRLGADVPFFIYSKAAAGAAWAFGIGEVLKPAENLPNLCFLLVNPGFEVSTRQVYEGLGMTAQKDGKPGEKTELTNGPTPFNMPVFNKSGGPEDVACKLENDLEAVTLKLHPELKDIKQKLLHYGALGSLMSGSGPTVFGIFRDEKDASRAAAEMKRDGWSLFTARSLG